MGEGQLPIGTTRHRLTICGCSAGAAQTRLAWRGSGRLKRQGRDMNFDQMLELSAAMQAIAHLTDDHQEGVASVLEKRPGRFSGR